MDWASQIKAGSSVNQIAQANGVSAVYVSSTLNLAFLAPSLLQAICDGTQRADITTELLYRTQTPIDWADQERCFL